ncbi:MAG: gp33 family protein [Nitrospira sp.]
MMKAYDAAEETQIGDNILAQISYAAEQLKEMDEELAVAEAALKQKKEVRRQMAEETLPALMDAAGQSQVKTKSGILVTLDEKILANISEERKDPALRWLVENGHEALIRNEFKVSFPRNTKDEAEKFEEWLNSNLTRKANLAHNVNVHSSTLSSWVNEELAAGRELPLDLLGVTRRKVCKLK